LPTLTRCSAGPTCFDPQREANRFKPHALVLVCGADALSGDPRGGLRLGAADLCKCASSLKQLAAHQRLPLLVLGGGGYDFAATARAWVKVTAVLAAAAQHLPADVPEHEHFEHYRSGGWRL